MRGILTGMTSSPPTDPAPLSRRDRYRQATIEEIKGLARRQLAERGPGELSLRTIARDMGVVSSALYRYFASHDDLVSALCVDAYSALADAVTDARDAQPADDHARQWWAICHRYRRWSLDDRAAFALIHGTPVPGYEAPVEVTGPAAGRIAAVMLEVFAGAVRAGAADPARTQVPPELPIGQLLHELLGESGSDQSAWLACIGLNAWASLRGFLSAEIFGSLSGLVSDTDQLYRAHVRTVMTGMGFEPALIDAADTDREPRPATQST
jgi:AcrR family transcriptional regulator